MTSPNKTNQLYLDYARVIEMCVGTALEDRPWECMKAKDLGGNTSTMEEHPSLSDMVFPDSAEFAVAILEDKPVFVGDQIYYKCDGENVIVENTTDGDVFVKHENCELNCLSIPELKDNFTWQSPKPKHTFNLSEVELPCPSFYSNISGSPGFLLLRDGHTENTFCFDSKEQASSVFSAISEQLKEATKRE